MYLDLPLQCPNLTLTILAKFKQQLILFQLVKTRLHMLPKAKLNLVFAKEGKVFVASLTLLTLLAQLGVFRLSLLNSTLFIQHFWLILQKTQKIKHFCICPNFNLKMFYFGYSQVAQLSLELQTLNRAVDSNIFQKRNFFEECFKNIFISNI